MTRRCAWIPTAAVVAGLLLSARAARADSREECVAAYEQTQTLRDAGKLIQARQRALACTASACTAFIVKECTQWLAQIDAATPTVVFEVRDANGADTSAVQVSLDGSPWLAELDGKAKPIDPGAHVIRYAVGGAEREVKVQVREAEKARKLSVSFQDGALSGRASSEAGPPRGSDSKRSAGPWVVGALGLASLAAGGVMGGIVLRDHSVATDPAQCSPTLMKCTTAGRDAEVRGHVLGPATTAALVVGGVGVAVAAVWLGVRGSEKKAPTARPALDVTLAAGRVGISVRGSF